MNPRKLLASVLLALAAGVAQAVHVAEYGHGQALLFPYYTVRGGLDTLLALTNQDGSAGKALWLRFLEGRNSREVFSLNLYLPPLRTWSAAITRNAAGNPVLRSFDSVCTVPRIGADMPFSNANYTGYDRAGSGLERAREGMIEVLEMGRANDTPALQLTAPGGEQVPFAQAVFAIVPERDCAALAAGWAPQGAFRASGGSELAAPSGKLSGIVMLVDLTTGIGYSYNPVVLDGVFTAARHRAPGDVSPSLDEAAPQSTVLLKGQVVTSTWSRGADAVSAVLMTEFLVNEHITQAELNAGTDWVVAFPTWRYHVVRESDAPQQPRLPFTAAFDDRLPVGAGATGGSVVDGESAGACEFFDFVFLNREEAFRDSEPIFPTPPSLRFPALCWPVTVVTFNDTNVLGSGNRGNINSPFASGWAYFGFNGLSANPPLPAPSRTLNAIEGHRYFGLPAIGLAVQSYLIGANGGSVGNYGGMFQHKYWRRIGH